MRKKKYLFFIFVVIFVLIFIFLITNNSKENKLCINNHCFFVEIADTLEKRSQGLMNRESLDSDKGMLFIFDQEANHSIWMKNTLIPLDIIWINKNKEVVHIEKNIQPCKTDPCETYSPNQKAKYILEINAGQANQFNIKINDKTSFEFK